MQRLLTDPRLAFAPAPLAPATFGFFCDDGPPVDWRVRSFELEEQLSRPYKLSLELLTEVTSVDPDQLLGARCTLAVHRGSDGRVVHGLITRVRMLGITAGRLRLRVEAEPALAFLSQQTDTRFWQDRTAVEILRDVLQTPLRELGCALNLRVDTADLATRDYCVQYRESDLDFAARLMHEEGLTYYFAHEPGEAAEALIVVASTTCAPDLGHALAAVPFVARHTGTYHCQTLASFDWQAGLGTTAVVVRDWDWQTTEGIPITRARAGHDGRSRVRTRFEHDERRLHRDDGERRARRAAEEHAALRAHGRGESDVVEMLPGHIVALCGLERPDLDGGYLLVRVTHRGEAPDEEPLAFNSALAPRYTNIFECIPRATPFRAHLVPPRPRVFGPHTALVVGPAGEDIHTDEHGRIKVRFHWDRRSPPDDTASCWIRVAQVAAGTGWGGLFLPRVGMEVLVEFIDGDPERPLVTGCVYNGMNRPPYPLPDHKTRSTLKSESTPGGGFNEIRIEDAKGREELFLHAQRDLNEVALHDNARTVGRNQTFSIGADQHVSIGGDQFVAVTGDHTLTVEKGDAVTKIAAGKSTTTVHGDRSVTVETGDHALNVQTGAHAATVQKDIKIESLASSVEIVGKNAVSFASTTSELGLTGRTQAHLVAQTDTLTLQGHTDVIVSSSTTRVEISAPNEVRLESPQTVDISGATLRLCALEKIELHVGASSITIEPAGITVSSPKITSAAIGIHEICGAMIKLN